MITDGTVDVEKAILEMNQCGAIQIHTHTHTQSCVYSQMYFLGYVV